jgi:hypothetical protein
MSITAANNLNSFKSDSVFKYLAKAYQSLDDTRKDKLLNQVTHSHNSLPRLFIIILVTGLWYL